MDLNITFLFFHKNLWFWGRWKANFQGYLQLNLWPKGPVETGLNRFSSVHHNLIFVMDRRPDRACGPNRSLKFLVLIGYSPVRSRFFCGSWDWTSNH